MDRIVRLDIERLPEGVWLATSEHVQGLVAEAETLPELLNIVPQLIAILDETAAEHGLEARSGAPVPTKFELPIVVTAC